MRDSSKYFDRVPRWLMVVTILVMPGAWLIAPLVAWWLARRCQTAAGGG